MNDYTAVPTSYPGAPDEGKDTVVLGQIPKVDDRTLLRLTCLFSVLSTLLAFAAFLSGPRSPQTAVQLSLKRPNPYPGLQNVMSTEREAFKPILSLSQLLMQVETGDPSRRMHENASREHDSPRGILYPDDRLFLANSKTSTVVQFKNLDYGMERCVVHAVLPEATGQLNPAITLGTSNKLDVWVLDQDVEISPHNPTTWTHAPRRRGSLFATLEFPVVGEWKSAEFRCHSLGYTILEFACADSQRDCHVEFWQNRMGPNGIYLEQLDSLATTM